MKIVLFFLLITCSHVYGQNVLYRKVSEAEKQSRMRSYDLFRASGRPGTAGIISMCLTRPPGLLQEKRIFVCSAPLMAERNFIVHSGPRETAVLRSAWALLFARPVSWCWVSGCQYRLRGTRALTAGPCPKNWPSSWPLMTRPTACSRR